MKMPKDAIDPGLFAPCEMNCLACHRHCFSKKPCSGCLSSGPGKPERTSHETSLFHIGKHRSGFIRPIPLL